MRIAAVETLRTPLQPNLCILRLRTDDGLIGLGESFWGSGAVEAYLHETAAPVILALEDPTPERVATVLRPYVGFAGSGAETRGNGAVDIALWDLLGRRCDVSVATLLGGPVRQNMRVYNTCAGYDYIRSDDMQSSKNWGLPTGAGDHRPYDDLDAFLNRPEELVHSLLDSGITAMKVWPFDRAAEASGGLDVSAADLRSGMRILEQIRDAGGDRMDVMIEMHGQWSLKAATTILKALSDINPYWVEDPLRADSSSAYRRLRERTDVPIAAGETLVGRRGFAPLLDVGALDVALIDVGWTGGITEAVKITALADSHDVPFAPHDCTGPISFVVGTQLVAARGNGLIAESVRAFQNSWYPEILDGMPAVESGSVTVSGGPGLGVQLREEFLKSPDVSRRATTAHNS